MSVSNCEPPSMPLVSGSCFPSLDIVEGPDTMGQQKEYNWRKSARIHCHPDRDSRRNGIYGL